MKYNLIRIIIACVISTAVLAQTSYDDHRKYWYYKTRLNNDFVKVGLAQGESMPFNQRGFETSNFNGNNDVKMKLGDGTSTLGYYIAVLATEYKLLALNNQDTKKVKHELFCALSAINRLDYNAESLWQYNAYNLNGFFIRDDMPDFFANNYPNSAEYKQHFNYYGDKGFCSKFDSPVNIIESDWIARQANSNIDISMSQDQVYCLLFGLTFVHEMLPQSETDNGATFGGSGQSSLKIEARNIANRIINHIRNPKDLNGQDCGNPGNTFPNNWRIRNPTTCNLIGSWSGGANNAEAYAYPLAELQCILNGGPSINIGTQQISLPLSNALINCPGAGYHNTWSQVPGRIAWMVQANASYGINWCPNVGVDIRSFIVNLSAACNCVWGTVLDKVIQQIVMVLQKVAVIGSILGNIISFVWQWVQVVLHIFVPGYFFNNTSTSININSYFPGAEMDHAPLARYVLHGGFYQNNPQYDVYDKIAEAPACGIYNLGNGLNSGVYWSSDNRLDHPNRTNLSASTPSSSTCSGVDLFKGEYNGIDFLLYHNLYYLKEWKKNNSIASFTDLSDVYINYNGNSFPPQIIPPFGPPPNPPIYFSANIDAYETITAENVQINPPSNAYWRAGKSIVLKPGVEITGNGDIHMYIENYACATDNGHYRMANTDTTSSQNFGSNSAPFHHVNYPDNPLTQTDEIPNNDKHFQNHITELPVNQNAFVNALSKKKDLRINPTVTYDNVTTYFNLDKDETAFINVMDLNGKIILKQDNISNMSSGIDINLSHYAAGVYLLKFTTTNGFEKTQKIIKQ